MQAFFLSALSKLKLQPLRKKILEIKKLEYAL